MSKIRESSLIKKRAPRPPRPPNKEAVIEWFKEEEKNQGAGMDPATGRIASWFHGVYVLQSVRAKFNKNLSDCCPLCKTEREDVYHFLLTCSQLEEVRSPYISDVRRSISVETWSDLAAEDVVQLLIDVNNESLPTEITSDRSLKHRIESISRSLIYKLHTLIMGLTESSLRAMENLIERPFQKLISLVLPGVISREDAEKILIKKAIGCYLVRVSERVWGYTISFRAEDRCKHFLIDRSEEGYQFFGTNQVQHSTLADLVNFHMNNPITHAGQEKLKTPCGQDAEPPDYWPLFNKLTESTDL